MWIIVQLPKNSMMQMFRFQKRNHLISSLSFNLGGHRNTTDDDATIPFHLSLSTAAFKESANPPCLFADVVFPSLLISSSFSCSCHCPLQVPVDQEIHCFFVCFFFVVFFSTFISFSISQSFRRNIACCWCAVKQQSINQSINQLSPAKLLSTCQRILGCGHTIWVSASLLWLGSKLHLISRASVIRSSSAVTVPALTA